ncbi:MAG TPA: PHP domain-containing protein [Candidatus Gastranaerophilales bacterium]|nr:PHP domain-containing protein [Candidatus Gastranaerophilales bacterium]
MNFISKGAFHIHTKYSDGTGTIPQIAKDAKKAGLDWIIITDHNNLAGLKNNEEGWHDGLAVIVCEEITPDNGNHYLALDIKQEIPPSANPQEYINAVNDQGGFGFVAHPDESRSRKNNRRPLRWDDWNLRGFHGIEIWNYLSDWTDNYNKNFSLYHILVKNRILKGPSKNILKWWDDVNNETATIVPAVGSLDTHAFDFKFVKIFPYFDNFKTITNYLFLEEKLSSDFNEAKKQILNGLKNGNNMIVNRFWNKKNDEFCFKIITKNQEVFSGEKIYHDENSRLIIKLPEKAKIKLLLDGKIVLEKETNFLEIKDLSVGKYRFEAYLKNKPWIFSNPILCE